MEPVMGAVKQGPSDCGPASVAHLARLLGNPVPYPLPFDIPRAPNGGTTLQTLRGLLEKLGYKARYHWKTRDGVPLWIDDVRLPCIAVIQWRKRDRSAHAVVVTRVTRETGRTKVHFHDPDTGKTRKWGFSNWYSHFITREVIELE